MVDSLDYRVVLVLPKSRCILALKQNSNWGLPRINVPLWERPAEHLTRAIEDRWNIKTVVLDVMADDPQVSPCAIVEVRTLCWDYPKDFFRVARVDDLMNSSLGDGERNILQSILDGSDIGRGVFTRIGWVEEAQAWIQRSAAGRDIVFTGEMSHLNAGGKFCLIRFSTPNDSAIWLKAVGAPNTQEFGITSFLSNTCPKYLPSIIAMREDWHAWAMDGFGRPLSSSSSLKEFEQAAIKLARLQVELSGRAADLLRAHCRDHRIPILESHIDEIIAYLDDAMHLQTSTRVGRLSSAQLKLLRDRLHAACVAIDEVDIPDSLMHNDISPGSILSDGEECVFTDWCEGYVGNPFITIEQFCMHAARNIGASESWLATLRTYYNACWLERLSERKINDANHYAALISVLSCLYGRGEWLSSPERHVPSFQGYARSLARHMWRAAEQAFAEEVA